MSGDGGGIVETGGGFMSGGPIGAIGAYQARQGADRAAHGAQAAAQAAEDRAIQMMNEYRSMSQDAIDQYSKSSVGTLTELDNHLQTQEKNIARQESLIKEIDPTIIEASQQALKLLRGEDSSTLNPIRNQRDQQRQKLVNSLREQLGPGAETSTAGIQALTKFDTDTTNLVAGEQGNALTRTTGIGAQWSAAKPNMLNEIMGATNITGQKQNIYGNQANLMMQRAGGVASAYQPLIQTAGAGNTYDVMMGNYTSGMGKKMLEYGVQDQQQTKAIAADMMKSMSAACDQRVKTKVRDFSVDRFLEPLKAVTWEYIDPDKFREGRCSGVMAQDLAKSAEGSGFVWEVDGVMYIDTPKMVPALLAAIVALNNKISALEAKVAATEKPK